MKKILLATFVCFFSYWPVLKGQNVKLTLSKAHQSYVSALSFSADASKLISGDTEGTVHLWDMSTGLQISTIHTHLKFIDKVTINKPNNLYTSSDGGIFAKWDILTGNQLAVLGNKDQPARVLGFSGDGQRAIIYYKNDIVSWDLTAFKKSSNQPYSSIKNKFVYGEEDRPLFFFTPDLNIMGRVSDEEIRVYDNNKKKIVFERSLEPGSRIYTAVLSTDGKLMAIQSEGAGIMSEVIELASGNTVSKLKPFEVAGSKFALKSNYSAAFLNSNNNFLLTGGMDSKIRLWEINTAQENTNYSPPNHLVSEADDEGYGWFPITYLAVSPDDRFFVSASKRQLKLWKIEDRIERKDIKLLDAVKPTAAYINDEEGKAGIAYPNGDINCINLSTEQQIAQIKGEGVKVKTIKVLKNSKVFAALENNRLITYDIVTGKKLFSIDKYAGKQAAVGLCSDANEKLVVTSYCDVANHGYKLVQDSLIYVWSNETGKNIFSLNGYQYGTLGVSISPDGKTIACIGRFPELRDGVCVYTRLRIRFWSVPDRKFIREMHWDKGENSDLRIIFSSDSRGLILFSHNYASIIDIYGNNGAYMAHTLLGGASPMDIGSRLGYGDVCSIKMFESPICNTKDVSGIQKTIIDNYPCSITLAFGYTNGWVTLVDLDVMPMEDSRGKKLPFYKKKSDYAVKVHNGAVLDVSVLEKGKRGTTIGSDGYIKKASFRFDEEELPNLVQHGPDGNMTAVSYSQRSSEITVGTSKGKVLSVDFNKGKPVILKDTPFKRSVVALADSPVSDFSAGMDEAGNVYLWKGNTHASELDKTYSNLPVKAPFLTFSPDGKWLTGCRDGIITLWDVENKKKKWDRGAAVDNLRLCFSEDGSQLYYAQVNNKKDGHKVREDKPLCSVSSLSIPNGDLTARFKSEDEICHDISSNKKFGILLWVTHNNELIARGINDNNQVFKIKNLTNQPIRQIFANEENKIILLYDTLIAQYNINNQKLEKSFRLNHFKNAVYNRDSIVIMINSDDFLVYYNLSNLEEPVSVLLTKDNSFVAHTEKGYYFAPKHTSQNLGFTDGINTYTYEQYDLKYNRPDIILPLLGNFNSKKINLYYQAYLNRVTKMGLKPSEIDKPLLPPSMEIISNRSRIIVDQPQYEIKLKTVDKNGSLVKLFFIVNDVPLYGRNGLPIPLHNRNTFEKSVSLSLTPGRNRIQVYSISASGIESNRQVIIVNYRPVKEEKPNLHLIAIGVEQFSDPSLKDLSYPVKDARNIVNFFQKGTNKFGKIEVDTFMNCQFNKPNLIRLKEKLYKTREIDKVILFVASHGILKNNDFALASCDCTKDKSNEITLDFIDQLLDSIPARQKLILIDACYAGEVDEKGNEAFKQKQTIHGAIKLRSLSQDKKLPGNSESIKAMKELFVDLRIGSGATIISSVEGFESAMEGDIWNNSVFTYALLEGLKDGNMDLDRNGTVILSEFQLYLSSKVRELTNGLQEPTFRTEKINNDWQIW